MVDTHDLDLRVLILAPFGKDANLIAGVLQQSNLATLAVEDPESLSSAFSEGAGALIISEEVLHANETIPLLAERIGAQPAWSDLPVLVLTGGGHSTAATEFAVRARAPLGNVTLLERPLRPATLISAVRSAIAARRKQYELRDHLLERQRAEQALRRAHDALESLVEQRTAALRLLSARLLRVQDEERRRIARELHDSLGQYLTAAKINLDMLARSGHNGSDSVREAVELIERAIADTRTLSHLLHPPLLDEAGFVAAAKWYVQGFGKRSGMAAELKIPENFRRLPANIETVLFRVLQEALTNVHRHSRSRSVRVRLATRAHSITLSIQDHGKGIPPETLSRFRKNGTNVGVGLAGMRERIKELNGTLTIQSDSSGTVLKVEIPLTERSRKPDAVIFPAAGTFVA